MRDLRNGVKLKKVQERQYNPLPIEYQLTPYEMLMDDIRSKRYTLRKVMVSQENHWSLSKSREPLEFVKSEMLFSLFSLLFVFFFFSLRILKLLFHLDTNVLGVYMASKLCTVQWGREHETNTCSVLHFPCGRHLKFWKMCLHIISLNKSLVLGLW